MTLIDKIVHYKYFLLFKSVLKLVYLSSKVEKKVTLFWYPSWYFWPIYMERYMERCGQGMYSKNLHVVGNKVTVKNISELFLRLYIYIYLILFGLSIALWPSEEVFSEYQKSLIMHAKHFFYYFFLTFLAMPKTPPWMVLMQFWDHFITDTFVI